MTARRALRRVHLLSTVWFIACIGYLLVAVLRDQGFQWWVIFSLSGPYALVAFLLVSLYLFVLYRGIGEAQQIEVEHPLTTTELLHGALRGDPAAGGTGRHAGHGGRDRAQPVPVWGSPWGPWAPRSASGSSSIPRRE